MAALENLLVPWTRSNAVCAVDVTLLESGVWMAHMRLLRLMLIEIFDTDVLMSMLILILKSMAAAAREECYADWNHFGAKGPSFKWEKCSRCHQPL